MAASHTPAQKVVKILHKNENQFQDAQTSRLTPPDTPTSVLDGPLDADQPSTPCQTKDAPRSNSRSSRTLEFSYDLEVAKDGNSGRLLEFGRGVWSVVYKATTRWMSDVSVLTPPPSPVASGRILAVKVPLRHDAGPVLAAEAQVLSRVAATASADEYIVPFYGFITASSSIVMSAIPLALSTHIEECALRAKENFSTRTMLDPVMSMPCWITLAGQLIKGLDWLHAEAGVVHGDIKPHNILLRRRRIDGDGNSAEFQFEALYADFSSAHGISLEESSHLGEVALSALTPPFAAPELMTVAAMKAPGLSTPASDVFSLALTLLAAATGDLLLYPGTSSMQRLAMSREGYRVLDFVRSGHHGTRVPRRGLVERTIAPAVVKTPSERVKTSRWLDILSSA
ncbi:uncharacterized protein TRUGW13939_04507 [Talaromyces rugulosus]|uniref:mitogen-activated protein kinase kinase n=1 Tax=Talaromyces rugulosus TaxID=121627 RepID=A0A7H8QV88_TALRU|nr:uncharacterized protein TRUGW13939_04507 [Talaromyces rugulosus]QKX57395.1 hypothetical protein TRUGW13939_04507 [Talaromyces rugulosus]